MEFAAVETSLQEIVDAIVRLANPDRIVLFGSAARGQAGPESDIDLLVVVPEGVDERETALMLYQEIRGVGRPFELLLTTHKNLRQHAENPGLIYGKILREGKDVYVKGIDA